MKKPFDLDLVVIPLAQIGEYQDSQSKDKSFRYFGRGDLEVSVMYMQTFGDYIKEVEAETIRRAQEPEEKEYEETEDE